MWEVHIGGCGLGVHRAGYHLRKRETKTEQIWKRLVTCQLKNSNPRVLL